jgi:uncharacterized protein
MLSSVTSFLQKIQAWALQQPGILAVALVGSHARRAARPDSDLDLVLLTTHPQDWIMNPDWTAAFGAVQLVQMEEWGLVTSLRVFYHNGLEVEFGITTADWAALPLDSGTAAVIANGMQILVDKGGLLAGITGSESGLAGGS